MKHLGFCRYEFISIDAAENWCSTHGRRLWRREVWSRGTSSSTIPAAEVRTQAPDRTSSSNTCARSKPGRSVASKSGMASRSRWRSSTGTTKRRPPWLRARSSSPYRRDSSCGRARGNRCDPLSGCRGSRRDLEQEALLELWRKCPAYDPRRGSWRTFSERVVANRMTSVVRSMYSERSGHFREEPLENLVALAAPNDRTDLRADVSRVLAGVSQFDRSVALCLIDYSAIETAHGWVSPAQPSTAPSDGSG